MEERNVKILNYLLQNNEMGAETTALMLEKVKNANLAEEIRKQNDKYNFMLEKIRTYIANKDGKFKPVGAMQKHMADMMIKMKTAMDDSSSNIAEMIIEGTNMGIIELTKIKNSNDNMEPELSELVDGMLMFQREKLESMKKYLV